MLVKRAGKTEIDRGFNELPNPQPMRMYQWMIDSDAGRVSIAALEDAWASRFGNAWVAEEEMDHFYQTAGVRLRQVNKLECHYLYDKRHFVFRLVDTP
jgi:hypothetical protein